MLIIISRRIKIEGDAIRAMCNLESDKAKSMEKTDKAMGIR